MLQEQLHDRTPLDIPARDSLVAAAIRQMARDLHAHEVARRPAAAVVLARATPVLRLEVDPSLIGGLVVQVGDDVYDASIRSRLAQLRDRLAQGWTRGLQDRRDQFGA